MMNSDNESGRACVFLMKGVYLVGSQAGVEAVMAARPARQAVRASNTLHTGAAGPSARSSPGRNS